HIVEEDGFCLIKVSGETRKNEAVMATGGLSPYLKEKGIKVIMDMKELGKFEPSTLVGVLNGIRKEVNLLRGGLKLCSLKPEILNYLKQNRLDHIFQIYGDREMAERSEWRERGKK
ncbi:MAG: hypothetical protein Q7J12_04535, partial [Syntrophales bacterium]|nr:hypothetical protein [Syntrophales bacterium]